MIPRILLADGYTVGSGTHVSQDAKDYSAYHLVFRKQTKWMQDDWFKDLKFEPRFVFYGLQDILKELFSTPVTLREINEAEEFLKTFHAGYIPFTWDRSIWERIVNENQGLIPIRMWALKDGAVSFPGEPVVQIEAMDGFGELAGYFESKLLQVWSTSERATLMRHWLEYNKALIKKCSPGQNVEDELNFHAGLMTHDFGDRAGSCSMESVVLGKAHLTSHLGTDTVAAAYSAWKDGGKPVGCTIKALSHRIVQGFKREEDAYLSLYETSSNTYSSHVADCYDFCHAVDRYLIPLAQRAQETDGVIVVRPDSGNPFMQIIYVLQKAVEAGLSETLPNGLIAMTHLHVIEGDGMTFPEIAEINEALLRMGFSPFHGVVYGIGGYLRNILARDNFGATLKLCAVGKAKEPRMKFSETSGKESIPGLVKICREENQPTVRSLEEEGPNEMVLWYDGISGKGVIYQEDFSTVRNRVLKDFFNFPISNSSIFSQTILSMKKDLHAHYVKRELCEPRMENTKPHVS